ncbi:response regulator transcription factor [Exilibacterium tricleocarpae]|uniref:Response regulator transcription factor n=1 Tax=Exilibacterium tricleocarpae TaxID=2591008 RepID=A0A545T036_9GAMM|nr:response regulator transcription factor [Exilibacterium tricleocarpae]TQV70539.1 response regulator transcription factor [Exilibacterium tricleocarpae]
MRILVVEDNDRIADFLVRALKSEGHTCVRTDDGRDGLELGKHADFDMILLDLMLPGLSGLDICQELRMRGMLTPIIMLTAMDDIEDVVTGLKMGADDYITKPFIIDELLARIEAVGRRGAVPAPDDASLSVGEVVMDRKSMQVTVAGERIVLTAKELAVLELLMAHPNQLFSRERILSNVWGMDMDPLTNVVDVYVGKLRRKIRQGDGSPFIETVRGMGYRINTD